MGTRLKLSTVFHLQTDGQSERTIQILEDMLRACVINFTGSWSKYLPLMEFSYNNSYQATIGMAPYEMLYGRKCRSPLHWDEVGERRYLGITYEGIMHFRKKGKVKPKIYSVLLKYRFGAGQVAYHLALPPTLAETHNFFHISMLRKYVPDPTHVLKYENLNLQQDMSYMARPVRVIEKGTKVLRNKTIPLVKILWSDSSDREATWELEKDMQNQYTGLFSSK
ncbi:uncharacterized protein LOC133031959 [Cannabis sativa]|uniref:uncharacterized protein LOC133031959 n=1 Tax=Cannabis sativa TaxID=3483 RepID=UPI0029C9B799|nr:uncharacterized protein LOC133031959 [Cannabis sativa]